MECWIRGGKAKTPGPAGTEPSCTEQVSWTVKHLDFKEEIVEEARESQMQGREVRNNKIRRIVQIYKLFESQKDLLKDLSKQNFLK